MQFARETIKELLKDPVLFTSKLGGIEYRQYQIPPVRAIHRSIMEQRGDTIIVEMARQGGKNEIEAQIQTFLLLLFKRLAGEMVIVSPTYKPQTLNAMRRLRRVLNGNLLTKNIWKKESGYVYRIGQAMAMFFSGQKKANVVGATASLLLLVDEGQDVLKEKYDKDFTPMVASTNATQAIFGTAWTTNTLLAREKKFAKEEEKKDGVKRVFQAGAKEIAEEIPAYGLHVKKQVNKLGRQHPIIKTQYFLEEIEATGGMFPPGRRTMTQGRHEMEEKPKPDEIYAITIDVAGEDEEAEGDALRERMPRKDSTALTVARIDLETLYDEMIGAPTYKIVKRYYWIGTRHPKLYGEIRAICKHWRSAYVLVDETGVGEPLYSFLSKILAKSLVLGVMFTSKVKSKMGYRLIAAIGSGRLKDYDLKEHDGGLAEQFQKEMEYAEYEIHPGPGKRMSWGVPDGKRDENGEIVHDDLLVGAAMFTELDDEEWPAMGDKGTVIIQGEDPLSFIDEGEW